MSDGTHDDMDGMCTAKVGDVLVNRFDIKAIAGRGTFGTVYHCVDRKYNVPVAVKVIRSVSRYLDAARVERDIIMDIQRKRGFDKARCVTVRKWFLFKHLGRQHFALVFPLLGKSLFQFSRFNYGRGFDLVDVMHVGYQLLQAVYFLHARCGVIHTDLKPENVLFVKDGYYKVKVDGQLMYVPRTRDVRVIDFGSALYAANHSNQSVINTRQYRAPEVLLGIGYSYPSDLWSVGCILAEMFSGQFLFHAHHEYEHMALIEKVLGYPVPSHLVKQALRRRTERVEVYKQRKRRRKRSRASSGDSSESEFLSSRPDDPEIRPDLWFSKNTMRLIWPPLVSVARAHERASHGGEPHIDASLIKRNGRIRRCIDRSYGQGSMVTVDRAEPMSLTFQGHTLREFRSLLRQLLQIDPALRLTAYGALCHPFFAPIRHLYSCPHPIPTLEPVCNTDQVNAVRKERTSACTRRDPLIRTLDFCCEKGDAAEQKASSSDVRIKTESESKHAVEVAAAGDLDPALDASLSTAEDAAAMGLSRPEPANDRPVDKTLLRERLQQRKWPVINPCIAPFRFDTLQTVNLPEHGYLPRPRRPALSRCVAAPHLEPAPVFWNWHKSLKGITHSERKFVGASDELEDFLVNMDAQGPKGLAERKEPDMWGFNYMSAPGRRFSARKKQPNRSSRTSGSSGSSSQTGEGSKSASSGASSEARDSSPYHVVYKSGRGEVACTTFPVAELQGTPPTVTDGNLPRENVLWRCYKVKVDMNETGSAAGAAPTNSSQGAPSNMTSPKRGRAPPSATEPATTPNTRPVKRVKTKKSE